MIRVWHYWIIRPKALLLMLQFALLATFLLHAACNPEGGSLRRDFGLILLLAAPQICSYFSGLEASIVSPNPRLFLVKTCISLGASLLLTGPLFLISPRLFPGYEWTMAAMAISTLVLFVSRPLLHCLIRHKKFVEGLFVIGTGDLATKFCKELSNGNHDEGGRSFNSHSYSITIPPGIEAAVAESGVVIEYSQLREMTQRDGISRIVVADANAQNHEGLAVALLDCKLRGLKVEQAADCYEHFNGKLWLEALLPEWLIYSNGFKPPMWYLRIKSIMDVVFGVLIILLSAPLFLVIAIAIKLDSVGPVFFRQERVGLDGKKFILYKFRTMVTNAEQLTGPIWAKEHDPRITRVGNFLRRSRLDELPQAYNLLLGNMNLVGPRPERPFFVEQLNQRIPYYNLRHLVKPGITGWAQVLYRYASSVEDTYEKLRYDLYYAKHMSFGFDCRILLNTVKVVLFGRGR